MIVVWAPDRITREGALRVIRQFSQRGKEVLEALLSVTDARAATGRPTVVRAHGTGRFRCGPARR